MPKNKKEAQEAINGLLRGEMEKGRVQTREDVLNCLTEAGFEIARVTIQKHLHQDRRAKFKA